MKSNSKIKSEYRKRLLRLRNAIDEAIVLDTTDRALLPALYSVFSYMWCKSSEDLMRK